MKHRVTNVINNSKARLTGRSIILALISMISLMVAYPYSLANAGSLINVNRVDTIHNTHCNGYVCQTLTCINNNCQYFSTSEVSNKPMSSVCYLPCLPSKSP